VQAETAGTAARLSTSDELPARAELGTCTHIEARALDLERWRAEPVAFEGRVGDAHVTSAPGGESVGT